MLIVFEAAILIACYKITPIVCGFGIPVSRMFFVGCVLGALIASFFIALVKYPIISWKFTQSLIISTSASTWIGYGWLLAHAEQYCHGAQWPGLAGTMLLPASFLLSAVVAILFSVCLPMRLLSALLNNNGKS